MDMPDRPGEIYDISVGHYCQRPAICIDGRGWVWAAVVANFPRRREDGEPIALTNSLWVKCRGWGRPDPQRLSAPGAVVWEPRLLAVGDDVWAVWMEWLDGAWRIVARCWRDGEWRELLTVADGPGHQLNPAVAPAPDGFWLAWQQMAAGRQRIFLRKISRDGEASQPVCLSADLPDSHRPAVAVDGAGTVWVAWDVYCGGHDYRVVAGPVNGGRAELSVLSDAAIFNGHCAMAAGADGTLWLAWYRRQLSDGSDEHRILLRRFRDGLWQMPAAADLPAGAICEDGHFRPALAPLPDGSLVIAWTVHGVWRRADLALRRIAEDAISAVHFVELNAQAFARAGAKYWFVQEPSLAVRPTGEVWAAYVKWQATQAPSLAHAQCLRAPAMVYSLQWSDAGTGDPAAIADARARFAPPRRPKPQPPDPPESARNLVPLFMDLHGHCEYSFDARGTADQWFNFARDVVGLDGVALTDHDVTPAEHFLIVAHANHYYLLGEFVALSGTEEVFDRPAGGEKQIIYFTDLPELVGSVFHVGEKFIDRELARELAARQGALVITHDGSFIPGCVDTDNQDERCELLAQITSTHTGRLFEDFERYVPGSRRPPDWPRVQDALRAGLRYGLVGGSDSHDSRPEGRTVVWVDDATREAVREALAARRCYATTGPRVILWTELAGQPMGSEVSLVDATADLRLLVWLAADEPVAAVAAVAAGGEQRVELDGTRAWAGAFDLPGVEPVRGRDWLYVRVEFASGARAWSSPYWVTIGGKTDPPR